MPTLSIIRGIPGQGKSTFAKSKKFGGALNVEADMFYIKDGQYCFDHENIDGAHAFCKDIVGFAMRKSADVVVSNTFTTYKELKWYIELAFNYGYTIKVYRMKNFYDSVHNVPAEVIEKMKSRFENYEGEEFVE